MQKRLRPLAILAVIAALGYGAYAYINRPPTSLVLTGIVTTNDVIVSPQVAGQLNKALVAEGDLVKKDQVLATITPDELKADTAYYAHNAEGLTSQVRESQAALRFQQQQTSDQIAQAQANLAAAEAQTKGAMADLEDARLKFERAQGLSKDGLLPPQDLDQARTTAAAAQAKVEALNRQVEAQRSAVSLARSNAEQVSLRRSQVQTSEHMEAAAAAQSQKAGVRLRYAEISAPIDGVVDVKAVREGEYVVPGQPVVTLINPDDLWVRVDVEESYIDRIRVGDKLAVRLPSGAERQGTVIYRGLDGSFATQRDVSRTKRDIKTFEVRLRVDNADRKLAVGMTAYVTLALQ